MDKPYQPTKRQQTKSKQTVQVFIEHILYTRVPIPVCLRCQFTYNCIQNEWRLTSSNTSCMVMWLVESDKEVDKVSVNTIRIKTVGDLSRLFWSRLINFSVVWY